MITLKLLLQYLTKLLKSKEFVILGILILLTSYVRLMPILRGDFPFLFDHGLDMMTVKEIVIDHNPTLIGPFTGLAGLYQGPLHYYLLAAAFIVSGGNPAGGVYFLALLYIAGTVLCFYLGKKMFNSTYGLVFAAFFSLANASVSATTHAWNPNWIPFLMIPFLYYSYYAVFGKPYNLAVVGFLAGIISQFEFAFGLLLPIIVLLNLFIFKKDFWKLKEFWMMFAAFTITFSPQIIFDIRNKFLMTNSLFTFIKGKNVSLGENIPFDTRFVYRIDEFLNATVRTISGIEFFRIFFLIFLLLFSTIQIILNNRDFTKKLVFLTTFPLVYFLFFLIYSKAAWSWYWVGLPVVYYAMLALVLSEAINAKNAFRNVLFPILIIWAGVTYFNYFGHPEVARDNPGTYVNMLRVVDSIYMNANGKNFSVFVYTPPIYTYAYDYLFWWRGTSKFNSTPGSSKDGLFYLVIEPNKTSPWESEGWKKTKIITGKTIWSKKFQGDITVERREGSQYN